MYIYIYKYIYIYNTMSFQGYHEEVRKMLCAILHSGVFEKGLEKP